MKIFEALTGGGTYDTPSDREVAAKELSQKCGYAVAALTILPIPGSEVLGVMPIHVGMIMGIGQIYGVEVTRESASQLLLKIGASVGLSLMGTSLATAAAKMFVPFVGGLMGAPFMYGTTVAIGSVARIFFEREGDLSERELKSIYEDTLKKAKREYDPARAKSSEAQDLAREATREGEQDPAAREAAAAAEAAPGAAAASPTPEEDPVGRLERLKGLLDKGLIEPDEYEAVKRRILDSI